MLPYNVDYIPILSPIRAGTPKGVAASIDMKGIFPLRLSGGVIQTWWFGLGAH